MDEEKGYQICPVCFWQDDGYIDNDGYYDTGANHVNLWVAQNNYKRIGACEKRVLNYVRKPKRDEPYIGELKDYRIRPQGIIIKDCPELKGHTMMDEVFALMENEVSKYNWLITDIEATSDTAFFSYPWQNQYYKGEELLEHLKHNKTQFIWGVFTAIPKDCKLSKEELLQVVSPIADENTEIWKPEVKIQHPLGVIEIVAWDSSLTIVIAKDYRILNRFYNKLTGIHDFEEYKENINIK